MTIDLFIEYNFAPIIGVLFQIIILLFSKYFNKKEKIVFCITIGLEILELLSYNIEFMFAERTTYSIWRVVFSVISYIVRPALIYPFIYMLRPETNSKYKNLWYLDLIPMFFVIIVQQFAFYTNWVFYYDSSNIFHRGPLGYVSHAITIFYLLEVSVLLMINKYKNKKFNLGLILVIFLYVALSMIFESIFDIRSLGISAGVFSIVFFMFYLQTNKLNDLMDKLTIISETDSLSKLYNRYAGEKMINKAISDKNSGVFMVFDIDHFKTINDTYGHGVGDEAIIKIAEVIKEVFDAGDINIRLGGDEFAIYSPNYKNYEEAKEKVEVLFTRINAIRLSKDENYIINLSIGLVELNEKLYSNFDLIYREADAKLYEAKKHEGNYIYY